MRTFTISLAVLLLSTQAVATPRTVSKELVGRWSRRDAKIQRKILRRQRIRPLSRAAIQRLVTSESNRQNVAKAKAALQRLSGAGTVKRGIRRGYNGVDVELSAKGLAGELGLRSGQSISWVTKSGTRVLKAETANRVVLKGRRHDGYLAALRSAVDKIVAKVAADPSQQLTVKEQRRLAMAPTDMRAEALSKHGFKLSREQRGSSPSSLKYLLKVKGHVQLNVFTKVFGPSVSTYLPGKGHSQYIHNGRVLDTFFAEGVALRTTNRIVYPVMLAVSEGRNLDRLASALIDGFDSDDVQGTTKGHGRPKGYWPPRPKDCATGNTCTTTHHRAPIGKRTKGMRWLDKLDAKMSKLARTNRLTLEGQAAARDATKLRAGEHGFLRWLSSFSGSARVDAINSLIAGNRASVDRASYKQLRRLTRWVEKYNKLGLIQFPLDLLGREQLKSIFGVPFDPKRPGTTDPVGPGFARQMYSSAPRRIPVVVKLEK